ncbi:hypothetical protein ES703_120565 [subsurface metagenome]
MKIKTLVKKWRKRGIDEKEIRRRLVLLEKLINLEIEMKLGEFSGSHSKNAGWT